MCIRDSIEPHDSYFIGADVFYTYAVQSNTWELRTKMIEPEDYIRIAPEFRERLLRGSFMPTIKEQFLSMLEYFGQSPIIVRSSSLQEDNFGNACEWELEFNNDSDAETEGGVAVSDTLNASR